MNYVSGSTFTLDYTIPISAASESILGQYHVEVCNTSLGTKKNVAAASITPAQAATLSPVFAGATGVVSFTGIPVPNEGSYLLNVIYADNADLDSAGFKTVGSCFVLKVAVLTTVSIP